MNSFPMEKTKSVLTILTELMQGPKPFEEILRLFDPPISRATAFRYLKSLREVRLIELKNKVYMFVYPKQKKKIEAAIKPFDKNSLPLNSYILKQCELAIRFQHISEIVYKSPRFDGKLSVKIVPFHIYAINNRFYLIALDMQEQVLKEYRIDRILKIIIYPEINQTNIQSLMSEIEFIVHDEAAKHYEPAFYDYQIHRLGNGDIKVKAKIHSLFRAKRLLLSYGENITVLSPAQLKNDYEQTIKKIGKRLNKVEKKG